jgi:hypothetical protein
MKQDKQPRRASKPVADEKRLPASDMNTLAKGGDKESNEPIRKQLSGGSGQARTSAGRKPGR